VRAGFQGKNFIPIERRVLREEEKRKHGGTRRPRNERPDFNKAFSRETRCRAIRRLVPSIPSTIARARSSTTKQARELIQRHPRRGESEAAAAAAAAAGGREGGREGGTQEDVSRRLCLSPGGCAN